MTDIPNAVRLAVQTDGVQGDMAPTSGPSLACGSGRLTQRLRTSVPVVLSNRWRVVVDLTVIGALLPRGRGTKHQSISTHP